VVAPVASDRSPWFEDHVYGCRQVYDDGDEGSWDTVGWYSPVVWAELDEAHLQLVLPEDCPEGDFAKEEEDGGRNLGYVEGQSVSIIGDITHVDEHVVVTVESHRGGSARDHRNDALSDFWIGLFCSGCTFLLTGVLFWMSLTGLTQRKHWKRFAQQKELQISRDRFWTLGLMHGWVRGREVEIRRRRGLGDGKLLPADLTLLIPLKPMMEPYRLRRQLKIEGILGVLGGEIEIGLDALDDQFVLQGVDVERWRALVGDAQVRDRLLELRQNRVQIRIDEGWIEVSWPGLSLKTLDLVMNRSISLVNRMEHMEGRGWQRAAKALSRTFEIDEASRWKIEDSESELPWQLCYGRTDQGWHQTRFTMELPAVVSERWEMAVRGQGKKIRTGDPILDDQIYLSGLEPEEVAALIKHHKSTEVLLAAIRAHDLGLSGRQIILRSPGLLAEPLEMIRDAKRLARLLIRVSR
jgi:hypothetical protein